MAMTPFASEAQTLPTMPRVAESINEDQSNVANTVLVTLKAHQDDKPNGFEELEILQIHPTLKLLPLRQAIKDLESQGKVEYVHDGGSRSRVRLTQH